MSKISNAELDDMLIRDAIFRAGIEVARHRHDEESGAFQDALDRLESAVNIYQDHQTRNTEG